MFSMCRYNHGTNSLLENDHPLASDNYLAFARRLKQIGLDNGIHCNQSHAPFPVKCKEIRGYLKRAIECTAEAGGKICVIHPNNDKNAQENAEMYLELLPFAKEYGVKIATENMWNWDQNLDQSSFDAVNSEFMVACLDLGHAEMKGSDTSAVEMIKALSHRLEALHIHDNDKWHDSHQIPFSMDTDFIPILKALKEIGYNGYFTFEADCFLKAYTAENAFDGIKKLANSAKTLLKFIKRCRYICFSAFIT